MTPREAATKAFYECEGNNEACLKAAFDAFEPSCGAETVRALSAIKKAAADYMEAVKSLGQQSGYNGLTFFEAPISKMPNDELGMEAVRRWQALNDTGKALSDAIAKANTSRDKPPFVPCAGCDGYECITECAYPGAAARTAIAKASQP